MKFRIPSIASLLFLDRWGWSQPSSQERVGVTSNEASTIDNFSHPPISFRPRLRYWIPDAHVDLDQIYDDIAQAGARGAAGVEVLGFYLYGATPNTTVPVDWNIYGWGTPAWKQVLDTAIRAHADHGLRLDFAMGPNQGQGVPAHEDDEGLQWDLVPNRTILTAGKSFHGRLPGWGKGKLQAVVTARITGRVNITTTADDDTGVTQVGTNDGPHTEEEKTRTQYTLAERSLKDVTSKVSEDGWLDVDFGDDKHSVSEHLIFAVYLVRSGARTQQPPSVLKGPQTTPTDYVHNGSWTVDHFSARGAQVMADFWEKHLLVNGTRESLAQVARCAWEDSIEINPNVYWTPDLPTSFARQHGYSLSKYLPLLFHENSLINHFKELFVTDEDDEGHSHVAAYRSTLTQGYGEYLDALRKWTHNAFDGQVAWSSQIGYNMAVDMQSLVGKADIPECEDLAFASNIDAYRQFTAPAYMAGKDIVSAEVGAILGHAFQMTAPRWLQLVHRLYAGGINAVVLHGLAYSGVYPNTTWPGYVPFTYAWSDPLGRHQPGWEYMDAVFGQMSRTMYILQQGTPKLDVAFYQKRTSYKRPSTNYEPEDLREEGFTYGYLDPETLASPEAKVKDGVLAPLKQGYKALVVHGSDSIMDVETVDTLAKHARAGLPLIFAGGLPSYTNKKHDKAGSAYVHQTLHALRHLPNVYHVDREDGLCEVVKKLEIVPNMRFHKMSPSAHWWPVWREDDDNKRKYAFIYHDGEESSCGTVEFQSTGRPYRYDAASGKVIPIGVYTQKKHSTLIDLELAPHQAVIIGFHEDEEPVLHATSVSYGVLDVRLDNTEVHAAVGPSMSSTSEWIRTSDGATHRLPSVDAPSFDIKHWKLVVEHWDPPQELTNIEAGPVRWNATHHLHRLASWQDIPELEHVSGRGYYTATFKWPKHAPDLDGAFLSLGPIIHTMTVAINSHLLPAIDPLSVNAQVDISDYLVPGHNTIQVTVATTLANRLAPIWESLRSSGAPPTGLFGSNTKPPGDADYGLLGPVTVTPYTVVTLREENSLVKQVS